MLTKDKAEILDKMGIEILPGMPGTTEDKIHHMGCVLLRYTCPIARHIDLRIAGPPSV